ncbi:thiol-disulfide oxidoreductase BdbD [Fictibacillus macauensis ZFHKF-1]|uniref:Thiol-disulfide oxidoreductase BdbD n=1 Tax=Fictibacillus macauensis ZFHKF-1 TaxID=1196324 RepID=I8AE14_9BACL|nr:thioredoxin domain-containing protein [Fictibacillus macauensis]EIT83832.1 thiol-disulfide oxidoreductase BdbD [Fictibacillus macauensis ZFHKF-1]
MANKSNKKKAKSYVKSNKGASSNWVFWLIGLLVVGIVVVIVFGNIGKDDPKKVTSISYDNQPYIGSKDAKVSVLEFGDYKCPVCKNFNNDFVPKIEKDFVDTGKIKFYFINYPFINIDSKRSAQFAETVYKELGNDTFWKFHKLLYSKQPDDEKYEKQDIFTEDFLVKTLGEVASKDGVAKVAKAFKQEVFADAIKKDDALVGKLGVKATPTLFINGKEFTGGTYDALKKQINNAEKEKKDE